MATPVAACGFECGFGHFADASNTSISTTTFRSPGLRALRCNPSAAVGYASWFTGDGTGFASSTVYVYRGYVRFATLPSATISLLVGAANGCKDGAWFNAADSKVYAGSRGTGSTVLGSTGVSVTTGVWYRLDVKVDGSANPHLIDVQVDGTACAQLSSAASVGDNDEIICGSDVINFSGDLYFDDILVSNTLADYPLGDGYVLSYIPNADGTHNVAGANDFERTLTGTDITNSTTDAYTLIDDRPLPTTAVDFINGIAPPNATDYVEWQYEDSTESTPPRIVMCVFVHHDAGGAGTNTFTITLREHTGGTSANVFSGSTNVGSLISRKGASFATVPGTSDAWTTIKFNALRSRFLVADASPDVYIDAAMLEAEFAVAAPTQTLAHYVPVVNQAVQRASSY